MDDSTDLMQEYLASNVGRFVIIHYKGGEKICGMLQEAKGGMIVLKTDTGLKFRKIVNIDEFDLPESGLDEQATQDSGRELPVSSLHGASPALDTHASFSAPIPRTPSQPMIHEVRQPSAETSLAPVISLASRPGLDVGEAPQEERRSAGTAEPVEARPAVEPAAPAPPPANEWGVVSEKLPSYRPVPSPLDLAVTRKMLGIEAQFEARIQNARLELLAPDVVRPPDLKDQKQKRLWESIHNRYNNAIKINELAPRFGRIQYILKELESLVALAPTSASVLRYYAYLRYDSAHNRGETLKLYREITYLSATTPDWYNIAVLALAEDQPELHSQAYYALGQVFIHTSLLTYPEAWYRYVGLIHSCEDYMPLSLIYQAALVRGIQAEEESLLFATCMYLLKASNREDAALSFLKRSLDGIPLQSLLRELASRYFTAREVHIYQPLQQQWEQEQYSFWEGIQPAARPSEAAPSEQQAVVWTSSNQQNSPADAQARSTSSMRGNIFRFISTRNFGFLHPLTNREDYYFHRSAIADESLLKELLDLPGEYPSRQIEVIFTPSHGPRGPLALNVSRLRDIAQTFDLAVTYANEGEYEKANAQIKIVLAQNPEYPRARELYDDWRAFARARGVPRGSNPYARAKRKQLVEKDLEGAVPIFREAIRANDTIESAIKDLAALLAQLDRTREAIDVLLEYRSKIADQQSVNNLLINFYQKTGEHTRAVALLRQALHASRGNRNAQISWQIGICYLSMENYKEAERWFREVSKLDNNKSAQRNLAMCLFKQEREEEAVKLLQANLPDARSAELLDAILKARETGQSVDIPMVDIEMTLADFSSAISPFARFFLERCTYEGVDSQRRITRQFDRSDVHKLEELASRLGTRRPRERAEFYLSAAKIILEHEDWEEEYTQSHLYKYLCRSFVSRGDAAVTENKPLDTAREWYSEALSVYDGDRGRRRDEQDAVNALVRFLFATISRIHVPFPTDGRENLKIDEALEQILRQYNQPEKIFPAIAYLVFRSQYAANRILTRLYAVDDFQRLALDYLQKQNIPIPDAPISQSRFTTLWKDLQLKDYEHVHDVTVELHTVANRLDLTTGLEESMDHLRRVEQRLFFDHDRRQLDELQKILEAMLDLSKQTTFEEKERLCTQIEKRCKDMLDEIENNPTRISVENILPIIIAIREKSGEYLERIYESSTPQLTLRLPKDMTDYSPDPNTRSLEMQIVVENKFGCSPADDVELIIREESEFFSIEMPEIKLEGSLRGGEQRIKPVQIRVTEQALQSQAFSLSIYAQYRTRSGDTTQTPELAFPVNLYSVDQFQFIPNPYAAHVNGNAVRDARMFYGRSELIRNIAEAISSTTEQGKGIAIFGQKRSGKSSILYHLKIHLRSNYQQLLVVDLESVGAYIDASSHVSLFHQLLEGILAQLKTALDEEITEERRGPLSFSLPDSLDFYQHPSPFRYFQEILKEFKRVTARTEGWQGVHIVLLLDEFSYLYELILRGTLSEDFMKNWKALLQIDLFSVVLAGQDVMPKFKKRFPNEFAAIRDERISYLEPDEAKKLIDEPIYIDGRTGASRYREKAVERIVDLTAASPFYIQIFCNRLVEYMNRKRRDLVTQADIEQVKNELIEGANALDEGNFDNLISSGDTSLDAISEKEARAVLKAIAVNSRTGPCSRDRIIVEAQTDVEAILQDLLAREVIEAKGHYYTIRVGLFKEWLHVH